MNETNTTSLTQELEALQSAFANPLIGLVASVIFLAGLTIDIMLIVSFVRNRDSFRESHVPPKPWGLPELGLIVSALCVLLIFGWMVVAWIERAGSLTEDDLVLVRLLTSAIAFNGLGILAIFLLLRTDRISAREAFGIQWRGLGLALGRGFVFFLAVLPPIWLLLTLSNKLCQLFGLPVTPQDIADVFLTTESIAVRATIALMAVVAAPLFEELFFRGIAYPVLKQKIGFVGGMLVTSLVFAIIHFHVLSFLPLLLLAIALTLAYEATGNLAVPIVMHGLFNLMTIAVMIMVPS